MKTTDLQEEIWIKRYTKKDCIEELELHYNIDLGWGWDEWEAVMAYATEDKEYDLVEVFSEYYDNIWDNGIEIEEETGTSWNYWIEKDNGFLEEGDILAAWRHMKLDALIED